MSRRFIVAMLGLGLAFILMPQVSFRWLLTTISRRQLSTQIKQLMTASMDVPMA
jgi:hypothetical protein